jgi:hypothetical protein
MPLQWVGSPWGWLALGVGVLFLLFRWLAESKRHSPQRLWPAYLADLLALLLLVALVLQPVWEKQTYRFSKPEFWLAVDQSFSFAAGKTLGMDATVTREYEGWRHALEKAGFQVRTFSVTGVSLETPALADLPDGLDRSWSSLAGLNDALILAGRSVTGALYFGDGRDHVPTPQKGEPVSFTAPFYFLLLNQVSMPEVQPEGFDWVAPSDGTGGLPRGRLAWRPLGSQLDSGQACLLVDKKNVACWTLSVGKSPWTDSVRVDTLEIPQRLVPLLQTAAEMAWLVRPFPQSGIPGNDTLMVDSPEREGRLGLIWPRDIPSLDVTAIVRLLDMDSIRVQFASKASRDRRNFVAAYAPNQGPFPEALEDRPADLWLQVPNASRLAPHFKGPGMGWRMQGFSGAAKLIYAGESRRFLPSALGVLADISETPLELPAADFFSPCLLQAVEEGRSGCVVGWLPQSATRQDSVVSETGRFYWALPSVWKSLFSENGNPILERRVRQMGSGLLQWMLQTRVAGKSEDANSDGAAESKEWQRLGQDSELLRQIAEASGGKTLPVGMGNVQDTVTLKELGLLAARHEVGVPEVERLPLQLNFTLFALIVSLLGASWYWRKRFHLT